MSPARPAARARAAVILIARAAAVVVSAALLQHCSGSAVQGCTDIPERSSGPCGDVGLPPDWLGDSARRTH